MKPTLVLMVAGDGSHAARPGDPVALCGQPGRGLLTLLRSPYDAACIRCTRKAEDLIGPGPATRHPDGAHFSHVEEDGR